MEKVRYKTKREIALENDIALAIDKLLTLRSYELSRALENSRLGGRLSFWLDKVWAIDEILATLDFQSFDELKYTYQDES